MEKWAGHCVLDQYHCCLYCVISFTDIYPWSQFYIFGYLLAYKRKCHWHFLLKERVFYDWILNFNHANDSLCFTDKCSTIEGLKIHLHPQISTRISAQFDCYYAIPCACYRNKEQNVAVSKRARIPPVKNLSPCD